MWRTTLHRSMNIHLLILTVTLLGLPVLLLYLVALLVSGRRRRKLHRTAKYPIRLSE